MASPQSRKFFHKKVMYHSVTLCYHRSFQLKPTRQGTDEMNDLIKNEIHHSFFATNDLNSSIRLRALFL